MITLLGILVGVATVACIILGMCTVIDTFTATVASPTAEEKAIMQALTVFIKFFSTIVYTVAAVVILRHIG